MSIVVVVIGVSDEKARSNERKGDRETDCRYKRPARFVSAKAACMQRISLAGPQLHSTDSCAAAGFEIRCWSS